MRVHAVGIHRDGITGIASAKPVVFARHTHRPERSRRPGGGLKRHARRHHVPLGRIGRGECDRHVVRGLPQQTHVEGRLRCRACRFGGHHRRFAHLHTVEKTLHRRPVNELMIRNRILVAHRSQEIVSRAVLPQGQRQPLIRRPTVQQKPDSGARFQRGNRHRRFGADFQRDIRRIVGFAGHELRLFEEAILGEIKVEQARLGSRVPGVEHHHLGRQFGLRRGTASRCGSQGLKPGCLRIVPGVALGELDRRNFPDQMGLVERRQVFGGAHPAQFHPAPGNRVCRAGAAHPHRNRERLAVLGPGIDMAAEHRKLPAARRLELATRESAIPPVDGHGILIGTQGSRIPEPGHQALAEPGSGHLQILTRGPEELG